MTELSPIPPTRRFDAASYYGPQLYSDTKQYRQGDSNASSILRSLAKYNSAGRRRLQKVPTSVAQHWTMASAMKERYVTFLLASAYSVRILL